MTDSTPAFAPDYRSLTLAALILAILGWGGLFALIFILPLAPTGDVLRPVPGLGPRWLFFVLWLMALTGTALPFVRYLHRRFARLPTPPGVLLRQALLIGCLGAACAWLQISRLFAWPLVCLIAAGLVGIEWFLRLRERSRWSPDKPDEPA